MLDLAVAFILAAILGFSAQRASVCTVRAVAEILSSRSASILISFVKAAIWALPISVLVLWTDFWRVLPAVTYPVSLSALLGGGLFGIGAATNGACAFSTLAYFAEGKLPMLASFVGYLLGVRIWERIQATPILRLPLPTHSLLMQPTSTSMALFGLICAWILYEGRKLWRGCDRQQSWRELLLAERYRLSTAAMIIGICAGILYALSGAWTYSSVLRGLALSHTDTSYQQGSAPILLLAMFAGMVVSAWQLGRIHLHWRGAGEWLRRLIGGTLMGFGASLVPGGNDEIILRAFPLLSPHALPAFLGVLLGIACGLWVLKLTTRRVLHVVCVGDYFKENWLADVGANQDPRRPRSSD